MGKVPEQTFFQRRHTNVQQVHVDERMLNITNHAILPFNVFFISAIFCSFQCANFFSRYSKFYSFGYHYK